MASHLFSLSLLFLLFNLVSSEVLLEDGYTVTTVIDGDKLKINPHSVISPPGSSDLIVLDSSNSLFYTASLPLSEESVLKRLSGDGGSGYLDGEPGLARFDRPRSFTVDAKGNIYVADKNNHVIRKITNSGVTTIAGGSSKKEGHADGPAQNASFSNDFELTYVPRICALLVTDHGNRLIRQINLNSEDCARSAPSALQAVSVWVLALAISCVIGIAFGILIYPYIFRREGPKLLFVNATWRHYLIHLVRQVQTLCFDIRSVAANSTLYAILKRLFWMSHSHLSLMFRLNPLESRTPRENFVSLLDSDVISNSSHETENSQIYANQLKDLITFDRNQNLSPTQDNVMLGDDNQERDDGPSDSCGKLDDMIQANVSWFAGVAGETMPGAAFEIGNCGLVRKRK